MLQEKNLKFFSIGGQVNNSSSRDRQSIDRGFAVIRRYGMNTAAFPVYWSRLEPQEHVFDFAQVEYIIDCAARSGLKLVLLWFGTWKNGASHYAPEWVKRDHVRFPRVVDAAGNEAMVLSPLSDETLAADANAFSHLLAHIREYDTKKCVIAVQVENEPGIHAAPRDYAEKAEQLFEEEVPAELASFVFEEKDPALTKVWKQAGAQRSGGWRAVFGNDAEELFSAYWFARYINAVAEAGKASYDIPMYVNVWVRETQNRIPGVDYPCGGATSIALGLWKRFAPQIDSICPDIYFDDRETYLQVCSIYAREDNPLYIPESHADEINSLYLFEAIARYGLTGIHAFAIDATVDEEGMLTEQGSAYKRTVEILTSLKPLIERYHGTGRIHAVIQQEFSDSMFLDLGAWYGRVLFLNHLSDEPYIHLDNTHEADKYRSYRGKGLIVDGGDGVFYLAGEGFKLILFPKRSAGQMASALHGIRGLNANNTPYLSVAEGYMDENGTFVTLRERTGDESDNGLWVSSDIGLVRAVLDVHRDAR